MLSAFREKRFDREILLEMGEMGLFGATVVEDDGRAGLNHVAHGSDPGAVNTRTKKVTDISLGLRLLCKWDG